MLPASVLDRFIEKCPAAVMVRATLENLLRPERLDEIFENARERQYSRMLLFSELVALMTAVATRTQQSVRAAYLDAEQRLGVSLTAVYDKLKLLEPGISASLIRQTAVDAAQVIDGLPGACQQVLRGLDVYYLDGNHLAATEHRLAELRTTREGPLPGQTLALMDAQRELIMELVPCEDGHAQERSLLPELLRFIREQMVIVADRNFCTTKFLFGLAALSAYFIIRQHASTLTWQPTGRRRCIGRSETGTVYEQPVELTSGDQTLHVRRITILLDRPTEDGDTEIHLLTNLTARQASAKKVAVVYRGRWTIESAFQTLTDVLRCEVETLGYPRAALFAFSAAVLAFNIYAVVRAALRSVHGSQKIDEELSDHHLTNDVVAKQPGMDIAVEPAVWERYQRLKPRQLSRELRSLARHVRLDRYPKKKRGPKKPQPPKRSGARNHHISTARLLAAKRVE